MLIKVLFSLGLTGCFVNYVKSMGLEFWLAKLVGAKTGEDILLVVYTITSLTGVLPIIVACLFVNWLGFKGLWWGSISIGFSLMYIAFGLGILLITSNKRIKGYLLNKGVISFNTKVIEEALSYLKVCKSMAMVVFFVAGILLKSSLSFFSIVLPIVCVFGYFKVKGKVISIIKW